MPIPGSVASDKFSQLYDSVVPASHHTMEVAKQIVLNNPILMNEMPYVKDMILPRPYSPSIIAKYIPEAVEMENNGVVNGVLQHIPESTGLTGSGTYLLFKP